MSECLSEGCSGMLCEFGKAVLGLLLKDCMP